MVSSNYKCFHSKKKFLPMNFVHCIHSANTVKPLNPLWVTGYTDSDGCFLLDTNVTKTVKKGYTVKIKYQLIAHSSDKLILYRIKAFFNNVGIIIITKNYVSYIVENLSDVVNEIIPHFNKYLLQ